MAQFELLLKVGDQRPDFKGYRDGDVVCWQKPGYDWSKYEHKAFAILRLEIDEKLLRRFVDEPWTEAEREADKNKQKIPRLGYVDFDDLKPVLGNDVVTRIRDKAYSLPVLESPFLTNSIIKNYEDNPRDRRIFRPGSITSGTYTIGTGDSYDYSTIAAFAADIGLPLTGNLTGNVKTNVTETAGCTFNGNIAGYTILVQCDTAERHAGYPGSNVQVTLNHTSGEEFYDATDAAGRIEIRWLDLKAAVGGGPARWFRTHNAGAAHDIYIHHNLCDGLDNTDDCIYLDDADVSSYVYNNTIWDFDEGIAYVPTGSVWVDENNTIYSCATNGYDLRNIAYTLNNTVCHDNGTDFINLLNTIGNNCASKDGTAANFGTANNCIVGITDADFESVDDTNADFLDVPSGSDLEDAGIGGSYAGTDIHGRTRAPTWDIGASERAAGIAHTLTPTDSLALADSISKGFGMARSESFNLAESPAKGLGLAKAEAFSFTDSIAKAVGISESDVLALSDSLSRAVDYLREFSDNEVFSDAVSKAAAKNLTDNLSLADSISLLKVIALALSDTLVLNDTIAKDVGKALSDVETLADAIAKAAGLSASDTLALADALSKAVGVAVSDSITLADAAVTSMLIHHVLALSDTLVLSDEVVAPVITLLTGGVHKPRKDYKDHAEETVEWQDIIEIDRRIK